MRLPSVRLTELFVTDMDGQLRESGVGDLVVGKHIGRLMSVLGGRLGAYRAALAGQEDLGAALERNLTLAPGPIWRRWPTGRGAGRLSGRS
jgi:cytochrome b pre-mRNA-processing protein 3